MITRDLLNKINVLVSMLDPKEYDKVRDMIDSIIDDIINLYADYYKIKNDNVALHEEKRLTENKIPQDSQDEYEEYDFEDSCDDKKDYCYDDFDPRFLNFGDTFNSNSKASCENKDIKIDYHVDRDNNGELSKYMNHTVNTGIELTNREKVKYAIKFILEDYIYNLNDIDIYKDFKLTELVIGKNITCYMCEFTYHLENDEEGYTLHGYYEFMQDDNIITLTKPSKLFMFEDITCKFIEKDNYTYEFKIYHKENKEEE